jgi:hypothetical protein
MAQFIGVGNRLINLDQVQTITIQKDKICISFAGEGCVWLEGDESKAVIETLGRLGLTKHAWVATKPI